jgi:hypothetical protein
MAHYLVSARPVRERCADLRRQLEEGAFEALRPFGKTLTESLKNARITDDGRAVWEEEDYCSPPLAQEREAVLDSYFTDISVEPVTEGEGWRQIDDLPSLWERVQ